MNPGVPRERRLLSALFLVALATVMFVVLLTRVFSLTMWYHFAFMAISIAMFGLTVGALLVFLRPDRWPDGTLLRATGSLRWLPALRSLPWHPYLFCEASGRWSLPLSPRHWQARRFGVPSILPETKLPLSRSSTSSRRTTRNSITSAGILSRGSRS